MIANIAQQAKLLALNAGLEAARAGTAAQPFAGAAEEVRALAERTSQATLRIESLLDVIRKETTQAILTMTLGGSREEVEAGAAVGARAVASFEAAAGAEPLLREIMASAAATLERIRYASFADDEPAWSAGSPPQLAAHAHEKAGQTALAVQKLEALADTLAAQVNGLRTLDARATRH